MPEAPKTIIELVERFERNIKNYKSGDYKETEVRQEFIDPFFEALGWDVTNKEGLSQQFKDVILEDSIKVGGKTKAPDYAFRIGGTRIFFLEAKKPHVNIKYDYDPAFQLRRYAWSAKLPISVLTDFEELAIYESKIKPSKRDKPSVGRFKLYHYTDYVEKWDEIEELLSKDSIKKGFLENFIKNNKGKKGTSEVDDEFLNEIEEWRLLLARNIALRNKNLSIEELNYAVQLTIDRIIFLRMAEDRGIEKYGKLQKLLDKDNIYKSFAKLCKEADAKYNSGLFHFKEEKSINSDTDTLTLNLNIDNSVFKTIFKNLYYPHSPYEFSVLSPEILGNVYEQFLGKVIRLTDNHQAKIEEKPEVQKAGGVFYTPQYVVEHIIENTLGKAIKNKTPNQVSKIKILDPSCGSGSFLLGAYSYLLKWHLNYYINQKKSPKNVIYEGKKGEWFLSINEKKRILLNNIYGVDIDSQAVEVSKLSLLLKVLEDENKDLLEQQKKLFQERALPDLGNNIKCGNSLIGSDIYELGLSRENINKINPFDWEDEFSEIFADGGFDIVIGNPPYVGEKGNKEIFNPIFKSKSWFEFSKGMEKRDLFYYFFNKSIDVAKPNGLISFITTNYFLTADGALNLRTDFKKRTAILNLFNFNELKIFNKAKGQHNIITILKKTNAKNIVAHNFITKKKGDITRSMIKKIFDETDDETEYYKVNQKNLFEGESNYLRLMGVGDSSSGNKNMDEILRILNKIKENGVVITEKCDVKVGLRTGIDKISNKHLKGISDGKFPIKNNYELNENVFIISEDFYKKIPENELNLVKPLFKNSDINRYYNSKKTQKYVIYSTKDTKIDDYPTIKKHLSKFKPLITSIRGKKGEIWYSIVRPRENRIFCSPKIVIPQRSKFNNFSYNESEFYASSDVYFIIEKETPSNLSLKYILSLINSKLYYHWLYIKGKRKGESLELYKTPLSEIYIKDINKEKQKPFIDLTDKMIQLNKDLAKSKTPNSKRNIQRQIDATDKQIDKLVYELYSLTNNEIEIIENSIKYN